MKVEVNDKTTVDVPCPWLDGPVEVEVGRNHQVIVTELRPMTALERGVDVLLFDDRHDVQIGFRIIDQLIKSEYGYAPIDDFIGWMPIPRYIPK